MRPVMRLRVWAAAAVVAAGVACDGGPIAPTNPEVALTPSPTAAVVQQSEERTPFQKSLMQAIAERQAQGLPVPAAATYEYEEVATPAGRALLGAPAAPGKREVIARTILRFDNAEQAGLAQWPAIVVEGSVPPGAHGYIRSGDYTQTVKDQIAAQHPDAWTSVSFENGPRTYTFAESVTVTGAAPGEQMSVQLQGLENVTTADRLLLGFTILGPNLDYSIAYDVDICVFWFFGCVAEVTLVDFWAGFKLDWTIGTRLPMAMSLTHPGSVTEGLTFSATSIATGEDWTADAFSAAGVSPEDGREFILRFVFKTGVFLEVFGADVVDLGVDVDLDEGSSFATPLGPGQMFDLPTLNVSVWSFDAAVAAADIGVALTPQAGSDRYTAAWAASAEGTGSGNVTYTTSGLSLPLGDITAIDGPGTASVEMSGFRYYFTQFGLDLGVYFYLSVLGYGSTWTIPVTDFDLGGLMGGLFVEPHSGTRATIALSVPIENVTPIVVLARGDAVALNGVLTVLAKTGQTLTVTGQASDPGRDDLTVSWDWNDGPPAPDLSHTYTLPYHVSETQTHVFSEACVYDVAMRAVDDDQAVGEDRLPVVVTGRIGHQARREGYWQHQFAGPGHKDFTVDQLLCYLGIASHMSGVFGEERDISTIANAFDVLFMKQHHRDGEFAQLDRELLVAWLHFAIGAVDYTEPVSVGAGKHDKKPFATVMEEIEAARHDATLPPWEIRMLTQMLHQINGRVD